MMAPMLRIVLETARGRELARVHQDVTDRIVATYQEHAKILRAVIQRKITLHALLEARQRGRRAPA
jgi:hypothetical protein